MKKCIVIGGGFAGLTAAAYLSAKGIKVTLLEASPKLGGRAYSYPDKISGTVIDNGQHILMGCYNETLKFLKLIGAFKNFELQKNLSVNFLKSKNEKYTLRVPSFLYPFNLLIAILRFNAVSFPERIGIVRFFFQLFFADTEKLKSISVEEWLRKAGQSKNTIEVLWGIIAVGALNTNIKKASAKIFAEILKRIFLRGNFNSTIILPLKGLSDAYCIDAKQFIESNGGEVLLSETVNEIIYEGNKVVSLVSSSGKINDFDYVISAIPHYALSRIKGAEDFNDFGLVYSSILTFHIWLNENKIDKTFFGLINSKVHWIFNKGTHLTLVISDADELIKKNDDELKNIAVQELLKCTSMVSSDIKDIRIIKEKRATFIPSNEILDKRLKAQTKYENFFLAGDWVDTGLPSTIESAVLSGVNSVNMLVRKSG